MKANQKLVGTEYFTGYTGNKKYSEINFAGTQYAAIITANNTVISDLSLNLESYSTSESNLIYAYGAKNVELNNLNLNHNTYKSLNGAVQGVVRVNSNADITLHGMINISANGARAIFGITSSEINIADDARVNSNIKNGQWQTAIIYINGKLNIFGILNANCITGGNCSMLMGNGVNSGNSLNIYNGAEVTIKSTSGITCYTNNSINIVAGAKVNLKDIQGTANLISNGYSFTNTSSSYDINTNVIKNSGYFTPSGAKINWNNFADIVYTEVADEEALSKGSEQYATVMNSFDEIVEDSSYQGVNLLTGGSLTTMFNENRTHSFVVQGEDMRSNALGITIREWNTRDDIAQSIKEIKSAMGKVRDMVESLGNNLSIIQTRENFTDKLIDVLETGADDLVLADMNEESANYLALQTRNNLAVNALSLAAQSNNSVLKLF